MLKNYLKIAFRNLRKDKIYGVINIFGLAIGLSCCVFILLYIQDEWSYDRFHKKSDHIYRAVLDLNTPSGMRHFSTSPAAFAPAVEEEFSAIEKTVRLYKSQPVTAEIGDRNFEESRFLFADSSFFDVFSFSLAAGNPEVALKKPYSVVLTGKTARRYFGDEDPIGQSITIADSLQFKVTGIFDTVPSQSHFHFDFVASMTSWEDMIPSIAGNQSWAPHIYHTYLLLKPDAEPDALERQFSSLIEQRVDFSQGVSFDFILQPLTDIHLYSHREGELRANSYAETIYLFGVIGLLILLIACFNFINLSTARSQQRMKEVGIRKSLGANKWQLFAQFMGEIFLLCIIALVLALILTDLLLPVLNNIAGKQLELTALLAGYLPVLIAGFVIFVPFAAGMYPALFLSRFKPVQAIKGKEEQGGHSFPLSLRKGLVVFQFVLSVGLIISTIVVYQQLQFMRGHDLGFESEQVLVLPSLKGQQLAAAKLVKNEVLKDALIQQATISSNVPGRGAIAFSVRSEKMPPDQWHVMNTQFVDPDFVETYKMEVEAGRTFSATRSTDTSNVFMLNESAARKFGWNPDEAVGKKIALKRGGGRVIGVVKDFHYRSLRQSIEPLVLVGSPVVYESAPLYISLRVNTQNISETIAGIEETWESIIPELTFNYFFLNDDFNRQYQAENRLGKIFGLFSLLAIVIACMGLFGLTAFTTERRHKEVGIRKVLGATVPNIVGLLSKDFLKLVAIGFVIAVPVAWYAMNLWLADFAYKIDIGSGIFLLAGLIAAAIAVFTVGWQAAKAALANPVESLRSE